MAALDVGELLQQKAAAEAAAQHEAAQNAHLEQEVAKVALVQCCNLSSQQRQSGHASTTLYQRSCVVRTHQHISNCLWLREGLYSSTCRACRTLTARAVPRQWLIHELCSVACATGAG